MTQKGFSNEWEWSISKLLRLSQQRSAVACVGFATALLSLAPLPTQADQVETQNGDRYVGNVLSLSADTLVLQNEVLGTVQLPRSKVARIMLGAIPQIGAPPLPSPRAPKARVPSAAAPTTGTDVSPALRQLGGYTNLIRQVQKQFLADAGPEANQRFDELLGGLLSGKLTMNDLRAQAQSAADQLRDLKRQGGDDAGIATDTYLTILDHFLKETPPASSATNATAPLSTTKQEPVQPQD